MRSSALIALLPFLATATSARPSHSHHHHDHTHAHVRKSLSFGPAHPHASFELLHHAPADASAAEGSFASIATEVDVKQVARAFISERVGGDEGEGYYIRDDTYTDARTGITHVYARQIVNGLEVSDGDINLNIDRDGRVLSFGNSFHPGGVFIQSGQWGESETDKICETLKTTLKAHKAALTELRGEQGPWALVKSAAQVLLGGSSPEPVDQLAIDRIRADKRKVKHHLRAICGKDTRMSKQNVVASSGGMLSPVDALVSLLPRISETKGLAPSSLDFTSAPEHTLVPKPAVAEPPTEHISGPGLAAAGVVSKVVPARLMYTQTSGRPRLVWKLEVEMQNSWYEAYVDVRSGELLRIVDWATDFTWNTKKAEMRQMKDNKGGKQKPLPVPSPPKKVLPYSYNVFPWGVNDPQCGNVSVETEPWDNVASPLGWHTIPSSAVPWSTKIPGQHPQGNITHFNTTAGNNVIAHENWEGQNNYLLNYRPVNENLTFVYEYEEPLGLAPKEYVDMVITQLFYTSNVYHDLLYRLGFDELSGNFQAHNFGLGGRGGDPVITNAQDGSGYNNANFMTPPDGQMPKMRMYVWDTATPFRDGDLEAGIVIHEYSHGLSTRLTGGPANSGCLGYGEAGGMGEGWGDAIATLIRQIEEHKVFGNGSDVYPMGAWAANTEKGIRNYKYSTDNHTNPSTYKTLDKPGYWGVHAIGEVWAEFLFTVSQRLVEKYGFGETLFPPEDPSKANDYYTKTTAESIDSLGRPLPLIPKHGNTLALQLIIDAMKIQPCRPSFFDARDAIIQADQILTGGANGCIIWKAFAERGLGNDARVVGQTPWGGGVRTDGHSVPAKTCKGK